MTALVAGAVLLAFLVAFFSYGRFLGKHVFEDDAPTPTPAHTKRDGRDFVPTARAVLFGHHFTSVAGAAPIIGPCVAAYWGWLPALVWVALGTIFMGATHDFGALVASAREGGRSIADIAAQVMSGRARLLFMCFVLVLVWLVLAVFAMAIAGLFVSQPSSVLPVNISIVVAVIVGWLLYRRGVPPLWPSLVSLGVLYVFVWVGTQVPIDLVAMGVSKQTATQGWIIALFVYSAVASLLPVWLLLQPRDYVNSHQLLVGLGLLFLGLFVAHPEFDAPAVRAFEEDTPPVFPLLFVTIACGAISGFHGLVSSGTSSKQLDKLSDARLVGYGSMLGEGSLALASTLAAVAGIGLVTSCTLPGQGAVADLSWDLYYDTWAHAGQNKAAAFVLGGGAFLEALGLSPALSRTLMAVLVISFAATSLDTAMRIQRFILAELGAAAKVRPLQNPYIATCCAAIPGLLLAFWDVPDPAGEGTTQAAWVLWPIFGASNQMLASLTLMVLALYFASKRRPVWPLVLPMGFVMAVTVVAMFAKLAQFLAEDNWTMVGLAASLLALQGWMLVEGFIGLRTARASLQE